MSFFLRRTFGGLSPQYYFRQLFFGAIVTALLLWPLIYHRGVSDPEIIAIFLANAVLYPYARFVYESIVGFIVGDNVFFAQATIILYVKWITMVFCWLFALFLAPFGLLYLFWHHGRNAQ